jgi:hypothetical protein
VKTVACIREPPTIAEIPSSVSAKRHLLRVLADESAESACSAVVRFPRVDIRLDQSERYSLEAKLTQLFLSKTSSRKSVRILFLLRGQRPDTFLLTICF